MSVTAPQQRNRGYRHEALLYANPEEFMGGTLPFIRDAVAAEEPTFVLLEAHKIDVLSRELEGDAARVCFADMAGVGTNPARIIPVWQDFLAEHSLPTRRIRGIGEPIWAARDAAELEECHRHEALLNIAFSDSDFWLLCPYDSATLGPEVINEARRNHPFVSNDGISRSSEEFPGAEALAAPFDKPLPDPPPNANSVQFGRENLGEVRRFVLAQAGVAGLTESGTAELVLAVNEVATNSLLHGGGQGSLRVWREPKGLVCEIRDRGHITDPLAGRERPATSREGGRGLWLANQLCELVQIRSTPTGMTVRLHARQP